MFQMVPSLTMALPIFIMLSSLFSIELTAHSLTTKKEAGHNVDHNFYPLQLSNIFEGTKAQNDRSADGQPFWEELDRKCETVKQNVDMCKEGVKFERCLVNNCGFDRTPSMDTVMRDNEMRKGCCCILDKCVGQLSIEDMRISVLGRLNYDECKSCTQGGQGGKNTAAPLDTTTTTDGKTESKSSGTGQDFWAKVDTKCEREPGKQGVNMCKATARCLVNQCNFDKATILSRDRIKMESEMKRSCCCVLDKCDRDRKFAVLRGKFDECRSCNNDPSSTNKLIRQEAICWKEKCDLDTSKTDEKDRKAELKRICCCAIHVCKSDQKQELKHLFEECDCTNYIIFGFIILGIICCVPSLLCILCIVVCCNLMKRSQN